MMGIRELSRKSKILYAVQIASWNNWRETMSWLGFNVLGSLMPIWGSFFLLKLGSHAFAFRDFMIHGEFALYTAAFLAPAFQLIARNLPDKRYVFRTGSLFIALAGLVISALIYAGVVTITSSSGSPQKLNEWFLFRTSWIIFPASLIFVLCINLVQNQIENPPVSEIEESQEAELRKKFEQKLGGGDAGQ